MVRRSVAEACIVLVLLLSFAAIVWAAATQIAPVDDVMLQVCGAVMCAACFWAVANFAVGRYWLPEGVFISWAGRRFRLLPVYGRAFRTRDGRPPRARYRIMMSVFAVLFNILALWPHMAGRPADEGNQIVLVQAMSFTILASQLWLYQITVWQWTDGSGESRPGQAC